MTFVDLIDFENDYEILNEYPFTIRKKENSKIIDESDKGNGYIRIYLNGKQYLKHRLIAKQFLSNPENLSDVDHINHNRTDNHLSNLRWVNRSINQKNKSSNKGIHYRYVDEISDDCLVVDMYQTKTEIHYFENYYYDVDSNIFYYDNDANYRILHINTTKSGTKYVNLKDVKIKSVAVVINRFLKQHDLID